MPLYYATQKRIKEEIESLTKLYGFTKDEFIKEIDKVILELSTDEETGKITQEYLDANKNQIHFYKKMKNYLVISN